MTQPSIWNPTVETTATQTSQISKAEEFSAIAGQSLFTLTEFTFTPNIGAVELWVNGAYIRGFTEPSASTIQLPVGLSCEDDDIVVIRAVTDEYFNVNVLLSDVADSVAEAAGSAAAASSSELAAETSNLESAASAAAALASENAAAISAANALSEANRSEAAANRSEAAADDASDKAPLDSPVFINSLGLPQWTTAGRPLTPVAGTVGFNTTLNRYEGYSGSAWGSLGGGATGAGSDQVFMENDQTVTGSYTLTAGKNAVSAGPITIADGVVVTIPSGASWSIV